MPAFDNQEARLTARGFIEDGQLRERAQMD
jgi:hypothetical protein